VAAVAAAGLIRLPGGRRGLYLVLAVAAGAVSTVLTIGRSAWRWESRTATGPALDGIRQGLDHWGLPSTLVVTAVLVALIAGVGLIAAQVWRAGRTADQPA